jgi:glutaconate CoA-transferase subunit B
LFDFDKVTCGFRLRSVHPPYSTADIRANTGFDYEVPENVPVTTPPDAATLSLIRGRILDELAETYPAFAKSMMMAA